MRVAPGGGGSTTGGGKGPPPNLSNWTWEVNQGPNGRTVIGAVTPSGQLVRVGQTIPGYPGYQLSVPSYLLGTGGSGSGNNASTGGGFSNSGGGGGGGGGNSTSPTSSPNVLTQSVGSCPSILSNPLGWIACTAETSLGSSQLGQFLIDPVDALERIGLVLFGIILILIGIAILGFGPLAKSLGLVAGTATKAGVIADAAGSVIGGRNRKVDTGPSEEDRAERSKRLQLAERNLALGERKQDYREAKERRIVGGNRHKSGREPNPTPQHG